MTPHAILNIHTFLSMKHKMKNFHLIEHFENTLDIHPTIGKGKVDFDKIFELANQYDYKGALIMELHKVEGLLDNIEFKRNFV